MKILNFPDERKKKAGTYSRGFTLLEALIALTIISLIGTSVFMVFSRTLMFAGKIRNLNRTNRELIDLEITLRKTVSRIQPPFWAAVSGSRGPGNSLKIPWWNGKKDAFLEIQNADNVLAVRTPEGETLFTGFTGLKFSYLEDPYGRITGISLVLKDPDREEITFRCTFGSIGNDVFKGKRE